MFITSTLVLWIIAVLLVLAVFLPLTKLPYGAIQGLAFPRAQFLGAAVVCGLLFIVLHRGPAGIAGAVLMGAVVATHAGYIIKFTPLGRRQSLGATQALRDQPRRHISLLSANVKMSNRAYDRLIDLIRARAPDVVMAIEVDADWIAALKAALSDDFAHWVEVPQDNGYGLCLMSRLPLEKTEVRDLVTQDVPSIRTGLRLASGEKIRLYVVHPEPPVIDHDTIGRDSEIALVGLEAAEDALPAIVSGDLNDVAWSTTTRKFQRLSHLLDPRVGRGFYNTFSATMPWMRWPLDHLFHDKRFRLIEMERLGKIGSDHFPMWFKLALAETPAEGDKLDVADAQEAAETKRMIRSEQERNRAPIGGDWEQG